MNIHSLTCKLPSGCFACVLGVIPCSCDTQTSFLPCVLCLDDAMVQGQKNTLRLRQSVLD